MSLRPEEDDCECRFFDEGDWVECRLDTNLFGIVVGESNFGQVFQVQLAGSRQIVSFYGVTLRHMDDAADETPPSKTVKRPSGDNVIPVDFTKKPADLKKAKPQGAA